MKLDTTGIENYGNMTAEEKVAALEALELPDIKPSATDAELLKLKNALNKASSDVASYKQQLRDKMTEQEKDAADRKAAQEAMEAELAGYRKRESISKLATQYRGMGYTDELAMQRAEAVESGDNEKAISCEKAFLDALKKAAEENSLKKQPPLSSGDVITSQKIEDEQIAKLRKAMGV